MHERLQKLISRAGVCSRRRAEELIEQGRVTVNGETARLGMSADPEADTVALDGRPLRFDGERTYIMLNKPRGYVTTLRDEKGRRDVSMLVRGAGRRLYPVGRLDMYSEGLLIMTDDGEAAYRLSHPSHAVDKTYRAYVTGDLERGVPALSQPMLIDGYRIRPAQVERLGSGDGCEVLSITIHEGRNRQVRKMCARCGLKLHRLIRVSEGELQLGTLACGAWRHLTPEELRYLHGLGRTGEPDAGKCRIN